jgi:hypothetical protein
MDPCVATVADGTSDNGLQGIDDSAACPALTSGVHYLVEIPETFRKSTTTENNCLPNVFVPTPDGSTYGFSYTGMGETTKSFKDCTADSTGSGGSSSQGTAASSINNYTANCAYAADNDSNAKGCYQDETKTCSADGKFMWKGLAIADSGRCHAFDADTDYEAANYCAIPTNEFSCWSAAQRNNSTGNDTMEDNVPEAMYFMFVRIMQWMLFYNKASSTSGNMEYSLSTLGASTFMNPNGIDPQTKKPIYELNNIEDMAEMIKRNQYTKFQPLLIKVGSTFEWITLEDMYYKYGDKYLSQLSMFVFDAGKSGSSFPAGIVAMTKNGLAGAGSSSPSIQDSLDQLLVNDAGTMIGSYGYCTTLFNSPIFTGITFGVAALLIVIVLLLVFMPRS